MSQKLFDYLHDELGVTALESNLMDIEDIVLDNEAKKITDYLDDLPENNPLYKDSGLWQVRSDDMEEVLYQQGVNESTAMFIMRVHQNFIMNDKIEY